ncbi:MAG TPA: hypothetical protein VGF88_23665 [Acidobacteriaceae bacterium]
MSTVRPPLSLLSVVANIERHNLASGDPWILLMDVEWPGNSASDPGVTQQHVRLARNLDPITFDANDGNGPCVYEPFNFEMGEFNISSNGSVPQLEIQASNVMRVLQRLIEQYAGVVGANLYLYVVNTANPDGEPDLTLQFTILGSTSDAKLVHLKLGASSPMRRLFPLLMYWPNFCIWKYKSLQCGYTGALPTCSRTLDGTTGCEAHNNQLRFGGFPGIDTNGAQAAGVV